MKMFKRILLLVLIVACGFIAIAYSWTFTPQGRLDIAAAVIAKFSELSADPLVLDPARIEVLRSQANNQMGAALRLAPVTEAVTISDISIPGPGGAIRLRKYIPAHKGELPVMLWIHGGGFWMGNQLEDWDGRVAAMAADAEVAIFSVDYRLAPEHPWPAAVDDCYAALLWLHDNAVSQGLDANRIAVGGGSAGGNLAAAITLKARDEHGPAIAAQLLTVPATDASDTVYESEQLFAEGYVLTSQNVEAMIAAYLPNAANRLEPTASPLLAPSHSNLPPALVITAQYDPLRDEGEAYGKKLQEAGVPVEMIRYDGAVHGLMGSFVSMRDAHLAHVKLLQAVFSIKK
jgi:acetyl esterase